MEGDGSRPNRNRNGVRKEKRQPIPQVNCHEEELTPERAFASRVAQFFPGRYLVVLLESSLGAGGRGHPKNVLSLNTPAAATPGVDVMVPATTEINHCQPTAASFIEDDVSVASATDPCGVIYSTREVDVPAAAAAAPSTGPTTQTAKTGNLASALAAAGVPGATADLPESSKSTSAPALPANSLLVTAPRLIASTVATVGSINGTKPELLLEPELIHRASRGKAAVLVPCSLEDPEQFTHISHLIPHLVSHSTALVLIVQVLPKGVSPSREANATLLKRYDMLLAIGPGHVLMNPPSEPSLLRQAIDFACESYRQSVRRMRLTLDAEMPAVNREQIEAIAGLQDRLLWTEIPSVLMPHLPALNTQLEERPTSVANMRFVRRLGAHKGLVYEAIEHDSTQRLAVKIIEKSTLVSPNLLECVYRELVLLSQTISHPNIVKCYNMLHSRTRLYFILEFAGPKNLMQVLEDQPGYRLPPMDAKILFSQTSQAVAFCHAQNVALRGITLSHFVLKAVEETKVSWKIVDFHNALILRERDAVSSAQCGAMPCMAPEVLFAQNYWPRLVDCWAMGIVLLEATAGLGVLDESIQWIGAKLDPALASRIHRFFETHDCHESILTLRGADVDVEILSVLRTLLVSAPENRAEISELAQFSFHEVTNSPNG